MIIIRKPILNDRYIKSSNSKKYFTLANINGISYNTMKKKWAHENKYNEVLIIYLTNYPEKGFFELVKDEESLMYSCHFKTQTSDGKGSEKGYSSEPLTSDDKNLMFFALIENLPNGSMLSTHGEITPGGAHALWNLGNRSSKLVKIGEREVLNETKTEKVTIPIWKKKG